MKPVAAAIQLTKFWRTICPPEKIYPVDCRKLAEALGIAVHGEYIDDAFEAQLQISGDFRAIIYNENIPEDGRKNFSIAHELGHHSCHDAAMACSARNLDDMKFQPTNNEQEANLFAATLLMPIDDFRAQTKSQNPTLEFIASLARERYDTTLTATCRRLLDLSPTKFYGMAFVREGVVHRWHRSENMRYTGFGFRRGHKLPVSIQHNPEGEDIESSVWLKEDHAPKWTLSQSAVHMPNYGETLVLISAERSDELDEMDEPDPTPPRIPSF